MKQTKEQFILKCVEKFGSKFDYSEVNYIDFKTPVIIYCPVHGKFERTPYSFWKSKYGCPYCGKEAINKNRKRTHELFLKDIKLIHGDKYDYSITNYINTDSSIDVICPTHGKFSIIASSHLRGKGCPMCSLYPLGKTRLLHYINRSKIIHNNKYDYSLLTSSELTLRLDFICPIHGVFQQTLKNHLAGHGCPHCKSSSYELKIKQLLDKNNIKYIFDRSCLDFLKPLRLDFYLPEYNIGIECQGHLHFRPVDFRNVGGTWAQDELVKLLNSDRLKQELCSKHNIKLLYFTDPSFYIESDLYKDKVYFNVNLLLKEILNVN